MSNPAKAISRPRVALLIESSGAFGRGVLLGIAHYAKEHGPWTVYPQDRPANTASLRWLQHWQGDGVITRSGSLPMLRAVQQLDLPVVDLHWEPGDFRLPGVRADDDAVARLAAEHLFERGFRHFAFCGLGRNDASKVRCSVFSKVIQRANLPCHIYTNSDRNQRTASLPTHDDMSRYSPHLAEWLQHLPKPLGVMAATDTEGRIVLDACRVAGMAVPEEVAVVGVDNDEIICELSDPPLSSVALNHHRMGYEAAALLDRMIRKAGCPPQPLLVEPTGVITRRSTDVLAIEDPHVATAVRFIRQHACEGIDVRDVLRVIPLSRSALERKFGAFLHRSPKTEILRVRLNHARQLLVETDFSLALVAEKLGLKHTEYFNVIFKKQMGITPGQFRNQSRRAEWAGKPAVRYAASSPPHF